MECYTKRQRVERICEKRVPRRGSFLLLTHALSPPSCLTDFAYLFRFDTETQDTLESYIPYVTLLLTRLAYITLFIIQHNFNKNNKQALQYSANNKKTRNSLQWSIILKQFALKRFFCTTLLPCDCHDKFYDSFKQKKKRLRDALKSKVKKVLFKNPKIENETLQNYSYFNGRYFALIFGTLT